MKMQSSLTRQLASRFSAPKNIIAPAEVQEYKVIIEEWVDQFPPEYSFENPDTSKDQKCPWLFAQRFYVYTMACLLILNPIRHYMVKQYTWESPQDELKIRDVGIWYSLKLMKTLRSWVDKVYNRDGRLHFIVFSIFDTAAMLCTAVLKDTEQTIVNRQQILAAIGDAVDMLRKLNTISKTSKTSYDILERLVRRLPENVPRHGSERQVKRPKVKPRSPALSGTGSASVAHQQPATGLDPQQSAIQPQPMTQRAAKSVTSQQVQSLVAAPLLAAPTTTVPANNRAPPSHIAPHQYNYGGHEFAQGQHVSQNIGFMAVEGHSASAAPNLGHYGELQPAWSGASETTPPTSVEGQDLMASFSTTQEPGGGGDVDAYQQGVADPDPDFNIENLSDAQLGELAPLWNWHSTNLDFPNMPPPPNHPSGYASSM